MACPEKRLPPNVPGTFWVDSTCIDCDTCRRYAPAIFGRSTEEGMSFVQRQPEGAEEVLRTQMAMIACPTHSIGADRLQNVARARRSFPDPIVDGISFCGFTSEKSFGAWSYLIQRPGGNVMVDCPSFVHPLRERIAELGGIKLIFLTHRDDVADHARWADHFGAERILHEDDIGSGTRGVERPLTGDAPVRLADDLVAIPTPGHTRGHAVLLYRDQYLFSGDHLSWDEEEGILAGWPEVCWYDWEKQKRSTRRLLDHRFAWVLPGHGRSRSGTAAEMRGLLEAGVRWMEGQ